MTILLGQRSLDELALTKTIVAERVGISRDAANRVEDVFQVTGNAQIFVVQLRHVRLINAAARFRRRASEGFMGEFSH